MGETEDFEWDDGKDEANLKKHRVPLRFAIPLFDDPYLVQLVAKAPSEEVAILLWAMSTGACWLVFLPFEAHVRG